MKSNKPWVSALGVNPAKYQEWSSNLPPHTSMTFWCLAQGHLNAGEYLRWAQEHYGLAILRPEFFENRPNKEVYEMLASVANWSAEMIPVHEWDGVVFVACVEPVEEVQWSFPVRYVLASSQELQDYWTALSEVTRIKPKTSPVTAPAAVATPAPATVAAPAAAPAPQPVAMPTPPPPPEMTTTSFKISNDDAPGGLNLNLAAPARKERDFLAELSAQVGGEDEVPTQIKPLPAETDDNMPEGMTFKVPPMPEVTSTGIDIKAINLGGTPVPPPATPAAPTTLTTMPMPAAPTDAATPPPPAAAVVVPMPVATPAAAATPTAAPAAAGASAMSAQAQTFGEPFFRDIQNEFEGAMILLTSGEKLTPWAWDAAFAPASHQGPAVDLAKPSAFRIAYRTKMPYLGHVVETPTNVEFFKGWGYMQMPENIVAYPLVHQGTVAGVLLLKAKKGHKQSHLLTASEQFANRIAHALAQVTGKAA